MEKASMELTILMPCLNEAEALGGCIEHARGFLAASGIDGEILVADNGSTDGSVDIARSLGARVVDAPVRGYGAAIRCGIENAKGRYVIVGDADGSYDFSRLEAFVAKLREGFDLVVGNRFRGGIAPGAMPFLHRALGNPVLSFIGRLFFRAPVADFHCGLRGFRKEALLAVGLVTDGMEFASEMIVRAAMAGLEITEVPTALSVDRRSRRPHLRTWRDGWRHLRFLLLFSPRWLFFYPSLFLLLSGLLLTGALLSGPVRIAGGVELDVHSMIVGSFSLLIGTQGVLFFLITRRYAETRKLWPLPEAAGTDSGPVLPKLEWLLVSAAVLFLCGLAGLTYSLAVWAAADFGHLEYGSLVRTLTFSGTLAALGVQIAFTAFLSEIIQSGC